MFLIIMESYNQFLDKYPDLSGRKFETHDEDLIFRALQKTSHIKSKARRKDRQSFSSRSITNFGKKIITWMLTTEDLPKAVKWMEVLNARDDFPFEQTAIRLIAENQIGVLDIFVGKAQYRLQKIVKYLDKLVECYWKHRPGMDELENQMIRDHKKLMKVIKRANCYSKNRIIRVT